MYFKDLGEKWGKSMRGHSLKSIPKHIQEQHQEILEKWNDNMFVSTTASKTVLDCIRKETSVTVTGNPGVGKTATMNYAALKMEEEGYTVVPTYLPEDIRNFYQKGNKMLFVVDNVGGDYALNPRLIDKWKKMSELIESSLENEFCKIISTCRLEIFKDVRFRNLSFFNVCECNLNSDELCLTVDERTNLAHKYFEENAGEVSDFLMKHDFFPLLCALYQKYKPDNIRSFFEKAFDFYEKEIDLLSASESDKDHCKVWALALCVIFNNRFKEEYLTTKNKEIQKVIKDTLRECNLRKCSFQNLHEVLRTLEGTLVVKVDKVYRAIHDKLYDFLAHYFGGKMSEFIIEHAQSDFISNRFVWETNDNRTTDIPYTIFIADEHILEVYIKRILRDWSKGEVVSVFANRNMKSPSFIAKLVDFLSSEDLSFQKELALMTDNHSHDSTLLQSCFVADIDLTRRILKFTVGDSGNNYIRHEEIDVVNKCRNNGLSPLSLACENNHMEILKMLLTYKADVNKCMNNGASPLYIACQNGHLDIVLHLLDKKVNANVSKCRDSGESPLYIACQNGHLKIVLQLLDKKVNANVNKCRYSGESPLYIACQEGHLDIVVHLLDEKVDTDVNKCMDNGASPLYIACQKGHDKIVKILLTHGVNINKRTDNRYSPLYVACYNNHINVVEELLKVQSRKVDIDLCDSSKCTPLYLACEKGYTNIARILLEHHADPHRCNKKGHSPFIVAQRKGFKEILDIIKQHEIP